MRRNCLLQPAGESALRISIEHLLEGVQVIAFDWTYLYVNETAANHGQRRCGEKIGPTQPGAFTAFLNHEPLDVPHSMTAPTRPRHLLTPFYNSHGTPRS